MRVGQPRPTHCNTALLIGVLAAGTALSGGCALTHKRAPATEELALQYAPPEMTGLRPVHASLKVRRFSALSPYDSTSMYYTSGGGGGQYRMDSYTYYQWVSSPSNQVTDLLYRDFAAAGVFRDVFPYSSTEQARFQVDGTVVELVMVGSGDSWQARLALRVSLIDSQAAAGHGRVVMQRQFEADQSVGGNSAEQYAAGMSDAMKKVSADIIRSVREAAAQRLAGDEKSAAGSG